MAKRITMSARRAIQQGQQTSENGNRINMNRMHGAHTIRIATPIITAIISLSMRPDCEHEIAPPMTSGKSTHCPRIALVETPLQSGLV